HAKAQRTRKAVAQQEKLRDEPRMHVRAVKCLVSVPCAARTQYRRPFEDVGLADDFRRAAFGQVPVAHIQDARGFVRAFEKLSGLHEPPAFVVNHLGVDDADEMERAGFDFLEEFAWTAIPDFPRLWRAD